MCGICCIFSRENKTNANLLHAFAPLKENIAARGPESFDIEQFSSKSNREFLFAASVLWLQGNVPTKQPLKNDKSVFLYNGDIFEGIPKNSERSSSDTTVLFELFNETNDIFSVLSKLQGPYAFVYLNKNDEQLYFGRDPFGRKSLLLGRTADLTILCSVARRKPDYDFIELPSIGIFRWDLKSNTLNVSTFQCDSPSFQTKLAELEVFLHRKIVVEKQMNVMSTPEFLAPDYRTDNLLKLLHNVGAENGFSVLLNDPEWLQKVQKLKSLLEKSIHRRISTLPKYCKNCIKSQLPCNHPVVGVLFSGGVDCSLLALLAEQFIDKHRPIDLFNVAFDQTNNYQTPDRQTGLATLAELKRLRPDRQWRFFQINVSREELNRARQSHVADVIHPLQSVLDDSLGCALWFAGGARQGLETSPCRVLLVGMGADELFGGYTKHRAAFKKASWLGLHNILTEDWQNLPYRNLARDDRVVSDHGRQLRMPYLDEDLVEFVRNLQCWEKTYPSDEVAHGFGDKVLLRSLAHHLGLTGAALLKKRALQFGSRIANKRENAHEVSLNLC